MNNKYKNGFINLVCYSFFMISVVFAQIDTVALSYYPLQNGNFWQYQENIYDWLLPSWDIRYKTFLVTGDTIYPINRHIKY